MKNKMRLSLIITLSMLVLVFFLMFLNFVYVSNNLDGNTLRLTGFNAFNALMKEGFDSAEAQFGSVFPLYTYDELHTSNVLFFTTIAFLGLILNMVTLTVGIIFNNKNVGFASLIASLFSGITYMFAFTNATTLNARNAESMTHSYAIIPAIVCLFAMLPIIVYTIKNMKK